MINKKERLEISYEDFLAILKKIDRYTYVLLLNDNVIWDETQSPTETNLSALPELLWKSLKLGVNEVENILEERFVEDQVEYFKNNLDKFTNLGSNGLSAHLNKFLQLSKASQIRIIQEDLLKPDLLIYQKSREREESIKEQRRVEREVRKLDKLQCVFCGKMRDTTTQRTYFKKPKDDFTTEKVFLSCHSCSRKNLEPKFGRFLSQND